MKASVDVSGVFVVLLLVSFIVMKILNVIDWPWIWVLSPIWIPVVIVFLLFLLFMIWTIILHRK